MAFFTSDSGHAADDPGTPGPVPPTSVAVEPGLAMESPVWAPLPFPLPAPGILQGIVRKADSPSISGLLAQPWGIGIKHEIRLAIAQAIQQQCIPFHVITRALVPHVDDFGRRFSSFLGEFATLAFDRITLLRQRLDALEAAYDHLHRHVAEVEEHIQGAADKAQAAMDSCQHLHSAAMSSIRACEKKFIRLQAELRLLRCPSPAPHDKVVVPHDKVVVLVDHPGPFYNNVPALSTSPGPDQMDRGRSPGPRCSFDVEREHDISVSIERAQKIASQNRAANFSPGPRVELLPR